MINKNDEIIPEEIWKKRILVEQKMELTSRVIADKIVQRAIELSNFEKLELRRKLEYVSKKELVRRIRVNYWFSVIHCNPNFHSSKISLFLG